MDRLMTLARTGLVGLVFAACLGAAAPAKADVFVNGVRLDAQTQMVLTQTYGTIPSGRYWYDPFSGLWGTEGGPSVGRILPGLRLGGPLQANASGGGTGVFVNGREIHAQEYALLVRFFGYVNRGRYWLGPTMIGGYEGGPAQFDLRASARGGGGGGGYNRHTLFGGLMSDGQCSGYLHPGGATVMTGNC